MTTPPNPVFSCDPDDVGAQPYVAPDLCVGDLDLSTGACADNDSLFIQALEAEALSIAAGPINIFPLLGVYNQGSTIDITGSGYPLSSGTPSGFNVSNAFNTDSSSWKSIQQGIDVITVPAYIGYDFGTKKTSVPQQAITPTAPASTTDRYDPPAPIKKMIRSIKLQQGDQPTSRASQVRIEASNDGISWIRIDVVNLMNVVDLVTYAVKQSAIYRMWRVIPLLFNGIASNSSWEVIQLQLLEENQLSLTDIEDITLMENRDRAYSTTSICMKAQYDLLDIQTDLSRFGIDIPQQYIFTVSFALLVQALGRPVVIGDIIEIPGETQYDTQLRPIRRWVEVTDTAWATDGYTPNWKPSLMRFYGQPLLPSMEHRDVLGTTNDKIAETDADFLSGQFQLSTIANDATESIIQDASDAVPETGSDGLQLASGTPTSGIQGESDQRQPYVEDGLPPDGLPYTEGLSMPPINMVNDGDYFRLNYPENLKLPSRLFQWSAVKNRWVFKEMDRRGTYESYRPSLSKIMSSTGRKNINDGI